MGVSIEWEDRPAGILRVHEPGEGFGGDYKWCCTVVNDGDTAVIKGATEVPDEYRKAICEELRKQGFKYISWFRVAKGWKKYSLRRWHGGNEDARDRDGESG